MMANFNFPRPGRLAAALLLGGLWLSSAARAQTLYNGPNGMVAVTDSLLYVRGDATGKAFKNEGQFNQTATAPARPRLFLDEGDLLNTGTWVPGLGTVVFNGASGTQRNLTLNGAILHHLRIDNPAAGSNPGGVLLGSSGQVDGVLRMKNGHLLTTTNYQLRLTATGSVFGETDASYVKGSLVQQQSVPAITSDVDFGGMGFLVNPQSQGFTLEVDRRTGLLLANYSFGQNPVLGSNQGIDRIWRLTTPAPPAAPVTLTLKWLADNDHGLNFNNSQAQVWRSTDNGLTWVRQGPLQPAANRSVTVSTTLETGAWYTVSTYEVPLPVELTSFAATARELDAVLKWSTASEHNSAWFAIERAEDGKNWMEISRKPAAGNSSSTLSYTATDLGAGRKAAAFYYRLHQIDLDGTSNYSGVQYVRFNKTIVFSVEAYPVPMQAYLTLDLVSPAAGPLQIELYDMTGRRVISQKEMAPMGSSRYQVDVRSLATGNYTLRAVQGGQQITRKVLRL
ncbi:hypothetical protein AUC43_16600 [Hymenobacter sedentarius]|uniref:Secretion system C-terminal sorting domain-containing protein n=1 Tax=Hymenobacter sedentarius TaxID=1411621 RepID=A0A0U4B0J3_9BACT|nr:T9SS type A sorting domain-containing protein [Hymenobacter sedentarius]ALW86557.1 hypothetical protein AUC43_16600 [Hymenobacter sedentarius]